MSRLQKLILPVALFNLVLFLLYKHNYVYDGSLLRSYCATLDTSPSTHGLSSTSQNQALPESSKIVPDNSQVPLSPSTASTPTPAISTPSAVQTSEQTRKATPPPGPSSIPKKLWYKMGPRGVSPESSVYIQGCLRLNPEYRHEFFTDITSLIYVKENFGHRPDIVAVYEALTIPILKADLLRYLILYNEGGVWSDLDVSCERIPINEFIPKQYRDRTGLVVGLEFDEDTSNTGWIGSQFASWWIMSRPKLSHMMVVVEDIVKELLQIAEVNKVGVSEIQLPMLSDVVQVTGPKRLTWSVVRSLEMTLGTKVDDRNISGLHTPVLIHDVLVMPGNAFASFQNGEPLDQGPVLVTHHYAGSWKNDKGGEA